MKNCIICKKEFVGKRVTQVLCGNKDCFKLYHLNKEKNRYNKKKQERKLIQIGNNYFYDRGASKIKVVKRDCEVCSKQYYIPEYRIKRAKHNLCSGKCKGIFYKQDYKLNRIGNGNPAWKGGHTHIGYKVIENGRLEHRVIMEKLLNRKLLSTEIVHHKDLNRLNNNVENLMLFNSIKEHNDFHNNLIKRCLSYIKQINKKDYENIINGK